MGKKLDFGFAIYAVLCKYNITTDTLYVPFSKAKGVFTSLSFVSRSLP